MFGFLCRHRNTTRPRRNDPADPHRGFHVECLDCKRIVRHPWSDDPDWPRDPRPAPRPETGTERVEREKRAEQNRYLRRLVDGEY